MEKASFILRLLDTKPQEVIISYEVRMHDGSHLPSGINVNTVFLQTQSISNINGSYAFDVQIPYGYTGRVLRYNFAGTRFVDFTAEDKSINNGYPLGTEPVYDKNANPILTEGPATMKVFSTFYDDKVTEDRRIVVELTPKTQDPIFDMHNILTTAGLSGRGSTGTMNKIGGSLWPNITTEDNWDWNKSVFAKDPQTLSGGDLTKYQSHWMKQQDGSYTLDLVFQSNSGGFILNSWELNRVFIPVPFMPQSTWNGSNCIEDLGENAEGTFTKTVINGATITLTYVRTFNNTTQQVYHLVIENARTNFTVTNGNLAMNIGAPELTAETVTGVYAEDPAVQSFQFYYQDWVHKNLSDNVVMQNMNTAGDRDHYGANVRFKIMTGYEIPSYTYKAPMINKTVEGTIQEDNTIKENSVISWDKVQEYLENGILPANFIFGPDENGWFYIKIHTLPTDAGGLHFMSLNLIATKISYIVRYMSDIAADNMPMFNPEKNPWDENKDKIAYISGAHIAEYDDNDGNFYDVVSYPNIVVKNITPRDKQNLRRFSYWSVVDSEDNISPTNPIVHLNTALKIAELAPYATKLAGELGGKDHNYYIIRLKAVWEQGIKI